MTLADIQAAWPAIRAVVHHTPVATSAGISHRVGGGDIVLKCENLQRIGSFKIRSAYHRLSLLTPGESARGVAAISAGNHAQGVALAGRTFEEAAIACAAFVAETDSVFISPYDDDGIITGQGTLGLELLEDLPDVETVLVPIGGGSLFAGVVTALKETNPHIRLVGVQSEGADAAVQSFQAGHQIPLPTHLWVYPEIR